MDVPRWKKTIAELLPMYDEYGYQSETYAHLYVWKDCTNYDFPYLIVYENRDGCGRITLLDVYQNVDDYDLRYPDHADFVGSLALDGNETEDERLLKLAEWLFAKDEDEVCYEAM